MDKTGKRTENSKQEVYVTIEEMKKKRQTSGPVYSGTCIRKGWGLGKQVTEAEYDTAVEQFKSALMGGR